MNNRLIMIFILGLCTSPAVAALSMGQQTPSAQHNPSSAKKPMDNGRAAALQSAHQDNTAQTRGTSDQGRAAALQAVHEDQNAASSDYERAYWNYRALMLEHDLKVYRWSHVASIIIFYLVIFLVLVGVLFSWLQFKAAAFKSESEEIDASMQGVKVKSSVLGVIILVLSMGFFYLYLVYVYPVNIVRQVSTVESQKAK